MKFPVDAPKAKVLRALRAVGFDIVREKEHIAMVRNNAESHENASHIAEPPNTQSIYASHDLLTVRHIARRIPARLLRELKCISGSGDL